MLNYFKTINDFGMQKKRKKIFSFLFVDVSYKYDCTRRFSQFFTQPFLRLAGTLSKPLSDTQQTHIVYREIH